MPRPTPAPGAMPGRLKDPCGDRPVKDVPFPPSELLMSQSLWVSDGKGGQVPDLTVLTEHLNGEGVLDHTLFLEVIKKCAELFEAEPNLLKLNDPITVVGDIHGQYYDLVKLLEVGGPPGDTQYIFLGDFVDRGSFSCETIILLMSVKIRHPKRVRMLRGNHECRQMTSFFNFREECEYKYDITIYNAIMDCFDTLPLAATINGKFLCVHGGLSPELPNLKAINTINRFTEPPREGLLCDLLWSDPLEPKEGEAPPARAKKSGPPFIHNDVRGCSYFFSFDGAAKFLQKNNLLSVIRAHEVQLEGYKMHKTNPSTGFPSVITIFSAPNYCDVYNNKGAMLKFDNSTLNILQFNCSPHPYHLPNFMDIFTWSMPFVIEKVSEMLYYILQPSAEEDKKDQKLPELPPGMGKVYRASLSEEQNKAMDLMERLATITEKDSGAAAKIAGSLGDDNAETRLRLQQKVRTVGRMARMFKTLRQENETVLKLKGVCPGHRLAPGLLLQGKEQLTTELQMFDHVAGVDLANEKMPIQPGQSSPKGGETMDRDFIEDDADDKDKTAAA